MNWEIANNMFIIFIFIKDNGVNKPIINPDIIPTIIRYQL